MLVVGGGINGAGIARDLAGRGLRVVLCEKDDLGAHTSSASTKLIHGGLRYLEYYEFGMVRKSLAERELLLRSAPHIMWPMRFVMPHNPTMRPAWMIRAGLFLYDHLARREVLPGSCAIDLRGHAIGAPLKKRFTIQFTDTLTSAHIQMGAQGEREVFENMEENEVISYNHGGVKLDVMRGDTAPFSGQTHYYIWVKNG